MERREGSTPAGRAACISQRDALSLHVRDVRSRNESLSVRTNHTRIGAPYEVTRDTP